MKCNRGQSSFLPVLWLFLCILPLCGCLTSKNDIEWQNPRLKKASSLTLNFSGEATGKCLVTLINTVAKDDYLISLDEAKALSPGRWSYVLPLKRPVLGKSTVKLQKLDSANPSVYFVDGGPLLEKTLLPVDKLSGSSLKHFLTELGAIRRSFTKTKEQDLFKATEQARHKMAKVLAELDINASCLARLKSLIENLDQIPCLPGSDIAERLLPLRFADALLSEKGYLQSPWGHVDKHLGIQFHHRMEPLPPPGFKRVDSYSFVNYVRHKEIKELEVEQWCWLATEKLLKQVSTDDRTVSFLYGNVIGSTTSDVPPTSAYKGQVTFNLNIPKSAWPPQRARLTLAVKVFAREGQLRLNLNDRHSIALFNSSFFAINKPDFRPYDFMGVSVPLPTKELQGGKNVITIKLDTIPFHEPPLPLRLRAASLFIAMNEEVRSE